MTLTTTRLVTDADVVVADASVLSVLAHLTEQIATIRERVAIHAEHERIMPTLILDDFVDETGAHDGLMSVAITAKKLFGGAALMGAFQNTIKRLAMLQHGVEAFHPTIAAKLTEPQRKADLRYATGRDLRGEGLQQVAMALAAIDKLVQARLDEMSQAAQATPVA